MTTQNSVAPFYEGWRYAQERLVERIGELSREQLELRAAPHLWPIWAITAHTAGVRPYWLCHIFREPGAERTPAPISRSASKRAPLPETRTMPMPPLPGGVATAAIVSPPAVSAWLSPSPRPRGCD